MDIKERDLMTAQVPKRCRIKALLGDIEVDLQ
jgi:hypothetical protein